MKGQLPGQADHSMAEGPGWEPLAGGQLQRGFAAGATQLAPSLSQATCRPRPSADSGPRPPRVAETSCHGTAAPCRPAPLLLQAGPLQVVTRVVPCRTVPLWPACSARHDVPGARPRGCMRRALLPARGRAASSTWAPRSARPLDHRWTSCDTSGRLHSAADGGPYPGHGAAASVLAKEL